MIYSIQIMLKRQETQYRYLKFYLRSRTHEFATCSSALQQFVTFNGYFFNKYRKPNKELPVF